MDKPIACKTLGHIGLGRKIVYKFARPVNATHMNIITCIHVYIYISIHTLRCIYTTIYIILIYYSTIQYLFVNI